MELRSHQTSWLFLTKVCWHNRKLLSRRLTKKKRGVSFISRFLELGFKSTDQDQHAPCNIFSNRPFFYRFDLMVKGGGQSSIFPQRLDKVESVNHSPLDQFVCIGKVHVCISELRVLLVSSMRRTQRLWAVGIWGHPCQGYYRIWVRGVCVCVLGQPRDAACRRSAAGKLTFTTGSILNRVFYAE